MSAPGSTMDIVHLAVVNTIPSASSNHQNHMVKYSRQGSLQNIVNEVRVVDKFYGAYSGQSYLKFCFALFQCAQVSRPFNFVFHLHNNSD